MAKVGQTHVIKVYGPLADAAPLGLGAFGLTTFMLSIHYIGWAPDLAWITLGIFYGGASQFIAGMFEFPRNNVFPATVFTTYGAFWLGLSFYHMISLLPGSMNYDPVWTIVTVLHSLGWYLTGFFIFNTVYVVCALQMPLCVFVVMSLLELTELCLIVGHFKGQPAGQPGSWTVAGGYFGFFCATAAIYSAFAFTWNSLAGKEVLPTGAPIVKPAGFTLPPGPAVDPASVPLEGDSAPAQAH